jgi:hypothetical protein
MSTCIFGHRNINESLGPIQWHVKGQSIVALSSQEAEYVAAAEATWEAIWLRYLNQGIKNGSSPVQMYIDNQGALMLIHGGVVKSKSKHISIKCHHTHNEEKVQKTVKFDHIATKGNIAYFLMKAFPKSTYMYLVGKCGLHYDTVASTQVKRNVTGG